MNGEEGEKRNGVSTKKKANFWTHLVGLRGPCRSCLIALPYLENTKDVTGMKTSPQWDNNVIVLAVKKKNV